MLFIQTAFRGKVVSLSISILGLMVSPLANGQYVTGFDTSIPSDMARPAKNAPYIDPNYGTRVTRVTDSSDSSSSWIRHEYSRRPAFNSDSSKALMLSSNGWWHLYSVNAEANTMDYLRPINVGALSEPNWDPVNPNQFRYFGLNGVGMKIHTFDIQSDSLVSSRDLSGRLQSLFGSAATYAWTKNEGRPSADGRVWCMMVEDPGFQTIGLIAYDYSSDSIIGSMPMTFDPDHISTSVNGTYCIPSVDNPGFGTRAYETSFSSYSQIHSKSEHSDTALDVEGNEVLVMTDYNTGYMSMVRLSNGQRTNLFNFYGTNNSASAFHISGVNSKEKPGFAVISSYACSEEHGSAPCDPSLQWFKDKVVVVKLQENPEFYNIAHTQWGPSGYWGETQAVPNGDLSKILFVSSWGSSSESDIASYMISIDEPIGGSDPIPNPDPVQIGFQKTLVNMIEGSFVEIIVELEQSLSEDLVVNLDIADVNTSSSDYILLDGTSIIIPAGQTTKSFRVYARNDSMTEPSEILVIKVESTNQANAVDLGAGSNLVRISIRDKSGKPRKSLLKNRP